MNNAHDVMESHGYSALREKTEKVVLALSDMSALIGEQTGSLIQLKTGEKIVPGLGLKDDAATLAIRAKDISQGLFNILVLGTFKNGKSTLLNALMGSDTLPAKAAPATAIITVLVYGKSEEVAVFEVENESPRIFSWEEFKKEFQLTKEDQEVLAKKQFIDRFQNIRYAQMERPHPFLSNGVKLVDSPGLEEHVSRTKVTTNYLKQSQAAIFVLDATKILMPHEKDFIEHMLGEGRLDHVFFVVNRINLVDSGDVAEIKDYVRRALEHHFLDETGKFAESLYDHRVFFVNAKGALAARTSRNGNEQELTASGILAFEKDLEHFLTSDEKVKAALSATVQFLIYVVGKARKKIDQDKLALAQPLERLEQARIESEKLLKELEKKKDDIERTILILGETVKQKIYANLMDYIDEMHQTWPQDALTLEKLQDIGFWNILKATASQKSRESFVAELQSDMQHYVEWKFGEWAQQIPTVIESDIDKMGKEIEAQVEEFQLKLDAVTQLFAAGGSIPGVFSEVEQGRVSKGVMLLLGVMTTDISGITGAVAGRGDWVSFLGRLLQQFITNFILLFVLGLANIPYLLAYIVIELFFAQHHLSKFRERLNENIGESIHVNLRKQLALRQDEIYEAIKQQFVRISGQITTTLAAQISETRESQEKILKEKKDKSFSVEQEQRRLDAVGTKLMTLFELVSVTTYGRRYTPEELDRLAAVKSYT